MAIESKHLDQIDENDLRELLGVEREAKTLEFKQQSVGSSEADKQEFRYDISSFANTAGGDVLFGVQEAAGIATNFPGVAVSDVDAEILRLESILINRVSPRINGVASRPVKLGNGNHVIIVRVPRSWAAPHLVIRNDSFRCYARTSAGKYIMDAQELRAAFLLSESIEVRIREFRENRTSMIINRTTNPPCRLMPGSALMIHFVPLSAFSGTNEINLSAVEGNLDRFAPIPGSPTSTSFNLDGFVHFAVPEIDTPSYVQVFRNGVVEIADAFLLNYADDQDFIPNPGLEKAIVTASQNVLTGLRNVGTSPPIYVLLSLLFVDGFRIGKEQMVSSRPGVAHRIDRPYLLFPEVTIQEYGALTEKEVAKKVWPMCDAIWNSAGYRKSVHFHTDGTWHPIAASNNPLAD